MVKKSSKNGQQNHQKVIKTKSPKSHQKSSKNGLNNPPNIIAVTLRIIVSRKRLEKIVKKIIKKIIIKIIKESCKKLFQLCQKLK